ncbi:MAG: FMN-binding protein [Clostridia bacterium]|nr:FMN-binding protein [Clostridia bacterium]
MEKVWTLNTSARKILKGFHLLFAACMSGGLVSVLVLLLLKKYGAFDGEVFPLDLAILKIYTWVVNYSFFGILVTSFVFELFTEWGFLKHFWLIGKWAIIICMFLVTWFGLGPAVGGMTSISDAALNTTTLSSEYSGFLQKALIFTLSEIAGVLLLIFISVNKPWGKRQGAKAVNRKKILAVVLPLVLALLIYSGYNSVRLNSYRNMAIQDTELTDISDGTYHGEAKVGSYIYKVDVDVKDKKITGIRSVDNRRSPYVTYAEGVFKKIIRDQNANTDVITGATTTSKAFMKAVENAFKDAESK